MQWEYLLESLRNDNVAPQYHQDCSRVSYADYEQFLLTITRTGEQPRRRKKEARALRLLVKRERKRTKMTQSNLERYKNDLKDLARRGTAIELAMQLECHPDEFEELYQKRLGERYAEWVKKLPTLSRDYQSWYSEALVVIKQLIPDRVQDFIRHYEIAKGRKDVQWSNYTMEDYLQGLKVIRQPANRVLVEPSAAIPRFQQQVAILKSAEQRFESSLFDIRQLVQADLLDSEIEMARVLLKNGFARAAGTIAGVIIEKHLAQVCTNHNVKVTKKNPTISDFNDLLKNADVLETPLWRSIQHLGDLRNLCSHNKEREPTKEEVEDLISGADKLIKTLF